MNGQWIGKYTGTTGGPIIVNIDQRELHYQGVAYLLTDDPKTFPSSAVYFRTPNKEAEFKVRTDAIKPIDPDSGYTAPWSTIKDRYPKIESFSESADVTGSLKTGSLTLSWVSNNGTVGNCNLPRSKADNLSELVAVEKDWDTYKEHVAKLAEKEVLFRGQKNTWRLRTSFHRSGRADLERFWREDIQALRRHLSARVKHSFNLENSDENGAFFNLVQHHGYPTPLLDWTYSPYVAAFFAYRNISNEDAENAEGNQKVRIHVFDQMQWRDNMNQVLRVFSPGPHLSVGEFLAIENERMIPQQAATTVTNVDDIESYIREKEAISQKQYLSAIDLPIRDRRRAVRELRYMGITAGSLFPGLDGACEELRERNFEG